MTTMKNFNLYTLAVGDRVILNGTKGVVIDNDGRGFTVQYGSEEVRYLDGNEWPFRILRLADVV